MRTNGLLIFLFLLSIPLLVTAQQTCTINDLTFTLDDVNNQNQGLTVHLSMSIKGMLNKTGKVFVFICDEDGNYINSTVPNFCTTDNSLCRVTSYTPSYQSSKYDDFTTFIPYYVIGKSLSNSKKQVLKIEVIVANENNKAIASKFSSKFSFSKWTNTCLVCNGKGISSCSFCGGFRQRPINNGYGLYYVMCQACNGTGQGACYVCGGRGNMGNTYYASYMNANKSQQGNTPIIVPAVPYSSDVVGSSPSTSSSSKIPCSDCHGSTLCSWCSGKGWENVSGTVKTCWRCNGYKYCHTCYGKGFIR